MNVTVHRWGLLCVAVALAGCGAPSYDIYSCAHLPGETCAPLPVTQGTTGRVDMHFGLVNPRSPDQPCAGELELGINEERSGWMSWHAHEQDPATCAVTGVGMGGGQEITGDAAIADVHFDQGDFNFRVVVRPAGE